MAYVLITQSQKVRGAQDSREKQRSKRRGEKRPRSKKIRKRRNRGKEKVGVQENCIIFDTDEQYGKRLMCAISRHKNLPFGVQLFTRADEMEIYLEHHTADMMVVSETCCEYGAEKPCEKQAKKMLVLTEEQKTAGENKSGNTAEVREIYKYQPADSILREIIQFLGGKEQKQEDVELIGVYSPVYEPLRSAFALSLTQVMAESGRTLYCNLEAFSGLEEVLAAQDRENLSDMIYYYRNAGAEVTEQMKQMIVSLPGFDYIAPVEFAQDISSMQTQELTEFFLKIAKECGYQKVVLEISSAVASQWKMIFACSSVYMPVRQDYISVRKVQAFEKYLLMAGMEHLWNRIEKVELPQNNLQFNAAYIGSREGEEMNGFVRTLFTGQAAKNP